MLQLWQSEALVSFDPRELERLGIPVGVSRVLAEVGLPRAEEPFFFADDAVSVLSMRDGGKLWRFGSDGGVSIAVHRDTGQVLAGAHAEGALTRFVNSSIEQFAESLCVVVASYRQFAGRPDDEIDSMLARLEARVREIDTAVLNGPEHWWAVLIEQMKDGLL
jgi:hypothetical protein